MRWVKREKGKRLEKSNKWDWGDIYRRGRREGYSCNERHEFGCGVLSGGTTGVWKLIGWFESWGGGDFQRICLFANRLLGYIKNLL